MNKYIKLTSLLLLIIVTLTGFGLYQAQASSPYTELKIVTSEGKPEYVEPFHLFSFVSDSDTYGNSSAVEFKNGRSQYVQDQPFLKKMDFNYTPHINELIETHRSFMRGKSRRAEQYTETDQHIFYTGMESDVHWDNPSLGQLTISVLDKETETEESYSVSLGNEGTYYDVRAAYINYPTLNMIITTNNSSDLPETVIYSFDVENPSEEMTEVINLSNVIEGNDALHIGLLQDKSERFIPIQAVTDTSASEFDYTVETSGYYVYDTQTQEVIDVPMFEEKTLLFTDNDTVYVGKDLGDTIELYEMNLDNEKLNPMGTIMMATPTIGDEDGNYYNGVFNSSMTILDGKFYAYETQHTDNVSRPLFQVTDILTQETLFNGTIKPKDTAKENSTNIDIFELRIKTENN